MTRVNPLSDPKLGNPHLAVPSTPLGPGAHHFSILSFPGLHSLPLWLLQYLSISQPLSPRPSLSSLPDPSPDSVLPDRPFSNSSALSLVPDSFRGNDSDNDDLEAIRLISSKVIHKVLAKLVDALKLLESGSDPLDLLERGSIPLHDDPIQYTENLPELAQESRKQLTKDENNNLQVNSNEDPSLLQYEPHFAPASQAVSIPEKARESPEESTWRDRFNARDCSKEREFLKSLGFFTVSLDEWLEGEPPANALKNALKMKLFWSIDVKETSDMWILSPESRAGIYSSLFIATNDPSDLFPEPVFRDIVLAKVNIMKKLQDFILHTYEIESAANEGREAKRLGRRDYRWGDLQHEIHSVPETPVKVNKLPNISYFIDDIVEMVSCLQEVIEDIKDTQRIAKAKHAFDRVRRPSWKDRWKWIEGWEGEQRWPAYICALRDALFGLWPAKGKDDYHTGEWDECITETLEPIVTSHNYHPYDLRDRDLRILEASYIETHGPFRFVPTHTIDDHLLIKQNKYINIYVDWRRLGGLRHHSVLMTNKDNFTLFDILMKRPKADESIRPFFSSLHHNIQISMMLLFFQDATTPGWKATQPRSILQSILSRFTRHRTSQGILRALEKDIGTKTTPEKMNRRGQIYVETIKGWPLMMRGDSEFRNMFAFRGRMDELAKTLHAWKPTTFWELRYPGYIWRGGRSRVMGILCGIVFRCSYHPCHGCSGCSADVYWL